VYLFWVGSKVHWHLKGKVGAAGGDVMGFLMHYFSQNLPTTACETCTLGVGATWKWRERQSTT